MSQEPKCKCDDDGAGGCLVVMFFLWLVACDGCEIGGDVKAIRKALEAQQSVAEKPPVAQEAAE